MSHGYNSEETLSDEEKVAAAGLREALERYMQVFHNDDTVQVVGYIMQASGSGISAGEVLSFSATGSSTERLGLLAFIDMHVNSAVFGEDD